MSLDEVLHVDTWSRLHPVAKLVVKILQHVKSKINDMAEIRLYESENSIVVTTYKSEIRITPTSIEFKRKATDGSVRVQRAEFEENRKIFEALKQELELVIIHNAEPLYKHIAEYIDAQLRSEQSQ